VQLNAKDRLDRYPQAALWLVGTTWLGLLLSLFSPTWVAQLSLFREFVLSHRLFTHLWAIPSPVYWLWPSALILLSGRLTRPAFSQVEHVILIGAGALTGAVGWTLVVPNAPFSGTGFVAWGYIGVGCVFSILRWRALTVRWRGYAVLLRLLLANAVVTWGVIDKVRLATTVVCGGLAYAWLRARPIDGGAQDGTAGAL
jgi:hypothetical protein